MTAAGLLALSPLIALTVTALVVMLGIAVRRDHVLTCALTISGLLVTLAAVPLAASHTPQQVTPLFIIDAYALFFTGLFTAGTLITALLCHGYFRDAAARPEEFYLLLLIATLGSAALAASSHLASFFLALETISVSLYALIGYRRRGPRPIEASIKYLVLVGVSTGFLAFGLALVYAVTGTLEFTGLGKLTMAEINRSYPLLLASFALIVVGLGFKLSLVPFHLWTPDVYQGAPAPVTGFLATVSKAAVFAVLLRYFAMIEAYSYAPVIGLITGIAVLSMLIGNWLALLQDNLKRLLAYSSIAHIGYLLVPLVAGDALAIEAIAFYFVAYFLMTLGAFGVIAALPVAEDSTETEMLQDYRGLFWRQPWLAGVLTLMLFALAGIPFTAGFVAKFYAIAAGVNAGLWLLVIVLVLGSAIGLFYYLRVVITMARPPEGAGITTISGVPLTTGLALALVTVGLVAFGVYPQPVIELLLPAVSALH